MEGTTSQSTFTFIPSTIETPSPSIPEISSSSPSPGGSLARVAQSYPPGFPRKVFAEVIGTFLLVFVGSGSAGLSKIDESMVSKLGASLAGGLIVTVMIYSIGHISGAHMNPAVSLAFTAVRHLPWPQLPFYVAAQLPASFSLDTATKKWKPLPPLPAPRYAPATQLWKGRLHVMGGSKENRHTPGRDHWSLAVKDGETLEQQWRDEVPIPRGGPHRACIAVNDRLFVIGGQEGDFMAKPGSPIFKCSRRHEVVYGDVYMLDDEMKWKILPPMPKPDSHIECAWVIVNNSIIITGGTTEKHPVTKRMMLVGEVFQFHLDTMKWSVIGKLPYRIKTTLTGFWDGWLYFTSGQRDRGPDNPQPKKVVGETWRTKLHLS